MNVQEAKQLFRGPMVSVATPLTPDFELDLDALTSNIRFMVERGVSTGQGVLLVAAAGGEFPMLSMEERKQVIKASVEAAAGEVPVAASIQFDGMREVVELARYAHDVGAVLGQLSSPHYYEPTEGDIFYLFETVSQESDLPVMIYNNWWTTPNMNVETAEQLAELRNVVALKWSAPSPGQITEGLERLSDKLAIIDNSGLRVWTHMLGAVGFITHVGNFWPEYSLGIWDLLQDRDYDGVIDQMSRFHSRWSKWVRKVIAETEGEGPFIKAAMQQVGLPAGPPRPPARPVSLELREELKQLFTEVGVPAVIG